jgi:transcriptional regulator with XRE-family HTH domain
MSMLMNADMIVAGDAGQDPFLVRLGRRVRSAREKGGISRRLLAERCGLSQRFLAQVEHGQGNISILRLKAVADALGLALEDVLGDARPCESTRVPAERSPSVSPTAVADLFRVAGIDEQKAVVDLLLRSRYHHAERPFARDVVGEDPAAPR